PPMDTVRIGFVGVGGQGTAHVHNLLRVEGCVIKAVDDIVPEKVTKIQDLVEQAGFPRPTGYSRGPTDFVRMCEQEELDLVFNATPWEWHVPICLAAMRNGNLYPTDGLGPVANCMDVNRGDRFATLVSMSSPSRGLQLYAREHFADGAPQRQERYVLGDVNWSLIMTANGRTICVGHDTNLPRPYSRVHVVQGTRGLFQGYPDRVYIEGRSKSDDWEPA